MPKPASRDETDGEARRGVAREGPLRARARGRGGREIVRRGRECEGVKHVNRARAFDADVEDRAGRAQKTVAARRRGETERASVSRSGDPR